MAGRPRGGNVSSRPPSASTIKSSTARTSAQGPAEFSLPAFSTITPSGGGGAGAKKQQSEIEKIRKKTIRRNAPPGEDLTEIRNIIKSCKKNKVSVQEFVGLVSAYTGDNGEALRAVMTEDLAVFYKLARKVYETITQDSSDVLLNQQLQLSDHYRETEGLIYFKLNKAIEGIYAMGPQFQFDKFVKLGAEYLKQLFPMPKELKLEPEELDLMKRQQAYHRLQWLKSEGERLKEENTKLQNKLNQFKKQYKKEQMAALQHEEDAEKQHQVLENAEAKAEHILNKLSESLEKSIVETETSFRVDSDKDALNPPEDARKTSTTEKKPTGKRGPNWRTKAAKEIDSQAIEKATVTEAKKVKSKTRQQKESFHFSPIKTPPQKPPQSQEKSPFHYSPPKQDDAPDCSCGPPGQQSELPKGVTRKETTTIIEERGPTTGRRGTAPKDTWGGFN